MVNQRELRERWTPQRAADAKKALAKSQRRKAIEKVSFGQHEGRWDLRGLPVYTNVQGVTEKRVQAAGADRDYTFVTLEKPPEFHNVRWESIDFSYAEIDHLRLFLSEVHDCAFAGGIFRDWRSWGVRFTDCNFSEANLQNSNIGGAFYKGRGVEYRNCTWRKGNLKNSSLSDGQYRDCQFEEIQLADEQIINASFARCLFSGRLADIRFDGRDHDSSFPWAVRPDALNECDFSQCAFHGVRFLGIDTKSLRLPNQGRRIPQFGALVHRAFDWINTAGLQPNDIRFLQLYWKGYVTQLPDDAEGWLDLGTLDEHSREIVEASMAGSL